MEVKDNSKRSAAQIKRFSVSKAVPVNSDIDASVKVPRKKNKVLVYYCTASSRSRIYPSIMVPSITE